MYKKILLGLCLLAIGSFAFAQPTTRIKLTQLEQGKVGGTPVSGLIGLTNGSGDQRYVTYVKVSATCYTGTPAPTGNLTNLSQFVIKCGSDSIWYIDWQGRSIFLGTQTGGGGAAVADDDWYKQSSNTPPNNTEIGWRKGVTIVGNKGNQTANNGYIPLFQVNDSITTNREVKALIIGGRDAYYSAKNSLNGSYVQLGISGQQGFLNFKTGESLTIASNVGNAERPSTGTSHVTVSDLENTIRFWKYPQSRVDTNTIRNTLYTDAQGTLRSRPVADLASYVGGTIVADSVTIFGTGSRLAPIRVGLLDSLNLKQRGVNLKNIEGAQAPTKNVMVYNGSRWVPSTPDYGNVYKDSVSSRERPYFEATKNAVVSNYQIDWDGDSTANLVTTLTANTALSIPAHIRNGGRYSITIKQDAVGGWGLSLPSTIQLDDGASINTQALSTSILDCISDGTNMYCSVARYGQNEGYNLLNAYYDSLDLYLVPSDFGNSFRLNNNFNRTKGISTVTGYGQRVYEYTDQSRNAFLPVSYGSGGDTSEPKTSYIDGRIAWNFDGVNDYFALRGSNSYTQLQSGDFTIAFWLRATQDGVADFIFSNNLGGGTPGWSIVRTSANKINFYMETSAGASANFLTTASITVASGWQWVTIRRSGNNGFIKIGDNAEEAYTFTPRTAEAYPNIVVMGAYATFSNWFTGQMGNCFFFRRNMASTTLSRFKIYNPDAPNLAPTALVRSGTFAPDKITGLDLWLDFSTVSTLKKDASGATAVTTNGDNIRRVNTRNTTALTKYALSPGSAQDAVYNTAQQNGLSASTWQSTDRMLYSTETELPVWEGQKSFFIVFKSTDTTSYRNLFSDGATNNLAISRPGSSLKSGSQNPIFSPLDSFRGNESYIFASLIRKVQWNVLEYRHRGNKWHMSVNGGNYTVCTQNTHSWMQTMLSHSSSNQFIGSMGEVVSYNTFLTNPQADLVVGYLCSKWGITRENTIPADADADAGRMTLVDNRNNSAIDYTAFPVATMRLDTLWISYAKSPVHNDSYGSQEGSFLRPFSPRTFLPIGPEIVTGQDQLTGTLLNRGLGGYNWLPDGRMIFSGTEFDGQGSPGGRDTINAIFRIRSLAGVMGSYTKIIHPVLTEFFSIVDKIHIVGANWYVVGYGRAIGESRYSVSIIKSTNSGTSWTQVARWNGNTLFGGTDPEEPVLLKTTDGRWQMYYRDDQYSQMLVASTYDIDNWNQTAAGLTLIGPGQSRPGVIEMSDKTLVMSVRIIPPSNPDLGPTYWYSSKDGGRTWTNRGGIDLVRERTGWANMYSSCVDLGQGKCLIVWGAENGFNGLSGGQISNISGKIVKP